MAAATSIIMGAAGLASAGGGIFQAIKGAEQQRDAQRALEQYKVPELQNYAEGIQVATKGAEMQKEMLASSVETSMDALASGGVRGLIGGAQGLIAEQNKQSQAITADIDRQLAERSKMIAQEDANLRSMREQRYMQDIAALSSQYNAGQQSLMSGLQGGLQGLTSGAQGVAGSIQTQNYIDALSGKSNKSYNFNPLGIK
jgi:hypothetical protein